MLRGSRCLDGHGPWCCAATVLQRGDGDKGSPNQAPRRDCIVVLDLATLRLIAAARPPSVPVIALRGRLVGRQRVHAVASESSSSRLSTRAWACPSGSARWLRRSSCGNVRGNENVVETSAAVGAGPAVAHIARVVEADTDVGAVPVSELTARVAGAKADLGAVPAIKGLPGMLKIRRGVRHRVDEANSEDCVCPEDVFIVRVARTRAGVGAQPATAHIVVALMMMHSVYF